MIFEITPVSSVGKIRSILLKMPGENAYLPNPKAITSFPRSLS